ncbi:hypothetical protein [uncultured Parabacteroides sp.]|uniref:hypothetical protein n=1 Tax=uncultured Parabacteroides sp. TaxID=512312 RepID=UPI0026335964|nr:hypothetical protein [uncultured Parabacteroides sp.]
MNLPTVFPHANVWSRSISGVVIWCSIFVDRRSSCVKVCPLGISDIAERIGFWMMGGKVLLEQLWTGVP